MTKRPPPPPPLFPPVPDLSGYRPSADGPAGPPPPIEHRFGPPVGNSDSLAPPKLRKPPRQAKPRRWLRAMAWTFATLIVLAGGAVAALVAFAPVGMMREQLIREVHVRTGRDLVIAGPTSLSVWPALAVSMGDVSLSAPPGMNAPPFVKMRRLDATVRITPLFSRRLEIRQLVLTEPAFELRIDAQGRRSWDFAALAVSPTIQYAQAPRGKAGEPQSLPPELEEFLRNSSQGAQPPVSAQPGSRRGQQGQDVALGDIRIDNGSVRYADERGGGPEEVRAINLRLTGKSLASPLEAKGDLALRGERIAVDARLGSPKALMEERPSRMALAVSSARGSGRYDGSLVVSKGSRLDGNLKLDTASLRGLAGWIGVNLPDGNGLGAFSLETELKTGPSWFSLNNAKARLDDVTATGSANVDLVAGRPSVKANLRIGALDLNRYLTQEDAPPPKAAPAKATATKAPPGQAGPQVRGFARRSGWAETPLDLTALGLVDADARLSMASLVYKDIKLGATQLGVQLKNRGLRADIEDMRLYGGQARGVMTIDGSAQAPAMAINLNVDGVTGLDFLRDAAGFDWIDGRTKAQIALGGRGASEKALVESLNGKAEFAFTDGAIVGYDIPQLIRGIGQQRLPALSRRPTERTPFSEAGATFQIRNGVAETKDLRAVSQHVQLTGAGTANLGQRQIDMTFKPKVAAQPAAGGGGIDFADLGLPFRIRGSWEKPQIGADLDSVLKNPGQAVDRLRELGKQLRQGETGAKIDRFIDRYLKR